MVDNVGMDDLGVIVAKLNAMARPALDLGLGLRLYFVERGWESGMIEKSPVVSIATTLLELDRALHDAGSEIVYIPLGALVTDDMIVRTCRGMAVSKTILKEVEASK